MAKKSPIGGAIQWGVVIVGSYVLYTKARTGDFGQGAKQMTDEIHKALGGLGLSWNTPGGGPPGTTTPPATTPPATAARCDFVPAYRYVAAYGAGFITVWKGQQVYFSTDQHAAEQYYNQLWASQGCV